MESVKPLISVIVPVYKAEEHLSVCVDSILAQTYENLEIILVDDGSPDNCGKICDEYAEKESRVKVVHKKNGGVSSARNAGLDSASGELIAFVDSDDSVHKKMFEELYNDLLESDADISACSYIRCYTPDERVPNDFTGEKHFVFSSEEALCALVHRKHFGVQIWAKLYRSETIKNVRFDSSVFIAEDVLFLSEAILNSRKVSFFSKPMYNYIQRDGSIMHNAFGDRNMTAYDASLKIIALGDLYNISERTKDELQGFAVMSCIYMAYELVPQKDAARKYIPIIKRNIRNHISRKSLAVLHRSRRIQARLLAISYTLFKLFFRLAKIKGAK